MVGVRDYSRDARVFSIPCAVKTSETTRRRKAAVNLSLHLCPGNRRGCVYTGLAGRPVCLRPVHLLPPERGDKRRRTPLKSTQWTRPKEKHNFRFIAQHFWCVLYFSPLGLSDGVQNSSNGSAVLKRARTQHKHLDTRPCAFCEGHTSGSCGFQQHCIQCQGTPACAPVHVRAQQDSLSVGFPQVRRAWPLWSSQHSPLLQNIWGYAQKKNRNPIYTAGSRSGSDSFFWCVMFCAVSTVSEKSQTVWWCQRESKGQTRQERNVKCHPSVASNAQVMFQ